MKEKTMKSNDLRKRLSKDRPMTSITIRMPEDVINELKRIAPLLGFSGYQPLIRAYIGQGLRQDIEKVQNHSKLKDLGKRLSRYGIEKDIIASAIAELGDAWK